MAEGFTARFERERQAILATPGIPAALYTASRDEHLLLRDGREVQLLASPQSPRLSTDDFEVYVLDRGETFNVKFDDVAAVVDFEEQDGIRTKVYRR